MYYSGIGSRNIPENIESLFISLGKFLEHHDFILRSGGARGADTAFETSVDSNHKEIYLPWERFNNNLSPLFNICDQALVMAEKFHPKWKNLNDKSKKFHARNCYQVLGGDLTEPSEFVLCWTPNGDGSGGTGQAIRIANAYNIPVFDFGQINTPQVFKDHLQLFYDFD